VRCFVVAGFLLTSASHSPSAIAELLVYAKLPTGLYILPSVISFFLSFLETWISGTTGPIFTIFAPGDRYLFEDDRFLKGRCHGWRSEMDSNMPDLIQKYVMAIL